jgi:ABC-type sugar transport system permease subunit
LQALGQVQVMTDGGPNGSTATLVYAIFHNAFQEQRLRPGQRAKAASCLKDNWFASHPPS